MKLHSVTLLTSKKALALLSVASLFLLLTADTRWSSAGQFRNLSSVEANYGLLPASTVQTVFWHAGNFRYLDAVTDQDLLTFVSTSLTHPNNGGYGKLSSTRKANFNAFLDALFTAIND